MRQTPYLKFMALAWGLALFLNAGSAAAQTNAPAAAGPAAGDPLLFLQQAQTAYTNGGYLEALDAIRAAEEAIWNEAPLGVRHVAFTADQAEGSSYTPKQGETFNGAEPIFLFFEPVGYTQRKGPNGYESSMSVSFDVVDAQGTVLGGQKNLGPYEIKAGRNFTTDYVINMTINLKGLAPGEYVLRVTITDNLAPGKTVQFDKPFIIAG